MERDELVEYCLAKPGAYLDTPWEDDEVVKVSGKIFCFLGPPDGPLGLTVKNTAEHVAEWRDRFPDHVRVPRYLQKDRWNRVELGKGGPDDEDVRELVDDSYDLIVAALPRSKRPS